jgi:hypothetical protein
MTVEINKLQLKVLLLDTVFHIRHKHHLAPNYHYMKGVVCDVVGLSRRCTSKKLLEGIRSIYDQVGLIDEYNKVTTQFNPQ